VLSFPRGNGLSVSTAGVIPTDHYSIAMDGVVTEMVTFDGAVFEHFDLPATLSAAVGTR
jgi:hypothetical protein